MFWQLLSWMCISIYLCRPGIRPEVGWRFPGSRVEEKNNRGESGRGGKDAPGGPKRTNNVSKTSEDRTSSKVSQIPSPWFSQDVDPRRSRPLPRDRLLIQTRFLTVQGLSLFLKMLGALFLRFQCSWLRPTNMEKQRLPKTVKTQFA